MLPSSDCQMLFTRRGGKDEHLGNPHTRGDDHSITGKMGKAKCLMIRRTVVDLFAKLSTSSPAHSSVMRSIQAGCLRQVPSPDTIADESRERESKMIEGQTTSVTEVCALEHESAPQSEAFQRPNNVEKGWFRELRCPKLLVRS